MSELTPNSQSNTQSFERFVALSNGAFWQAKKDVDDRKVSEGEILMIAQIDDVDGSPHTIHVRLHPSKTTSYAITVKFLVDEFVNTFEFVSNEVAEASRKRDIEAIQQRIQDEQNEMQQAYSNPKLLDALVDKEMPKEVKKSEAQLPVKLETFDADIVNAVKTQNLAALMSKGLTEKGVEQIRSGLEDQKEIALRRSKWIEMRTRRLTQISSEMTPFFEEKAALPLAMSKDMMDHVEDLMKGIGNLNLYVLKDVDIEQIKEGASAPDNEKLTVTQRVLFMDEEMAVWAEVDDSFDFKDRDLFCQALSENEGLVEQIFPTKRCVVTVAATRHNHEYEGYSPRTRAEMMRENARQFLLVRDGKNLFLVLSPDLFHNYSRSTFPTTDETESVFKGFDGRNITYRDLDYTQKLAQHDRIALGYKRLLILLCGLDHNKQLFGKFYEGEPSLEFVSMDFQEKYFNFIHDLDGQGMLASYRPESVKAWAKKMNEEISFGSRILLQWRDVLNVDNCPAAFERENRWNASSEGRRYMQYKPTGGDVLYGVVNKRGGGMSMKIEVSGERQSDYSTRTFDANLDLSLGLISADVFSILCVDRLNPKDAKWYLHDRPSRELNVSGIRMLKRALKLAESLRAEESEVRTELESAINESGLFDDGEELERIIDHAIAKWRCANPKADIGSLLENKKSFNLLCDQVFFLSGKGKDPKDDILASEEKLGRQVLRISLLPNGKYVAYSTPLSSERDDRAYKFTWVAKTPYKLLKDGAKAGSVSFVHLSKVNNAETIVYESEKAAEFTSITNFPFDTVKKKLNFLDNIEVANEQMKEIVRIREENDVEAMRDWIAKFDKERNKLTYEVKRSKGVSEPHIDLVLGASVRNDRPVFIGISTALSDCIAWMVAGNKEVEREFLYVYADIYLHKDKAKERLLKDYSCYEGKSLFNCLRLEYGPSVREGLYAPRSNDFSYYVNEVEGANYSIARRLESFNEGNANLWLLDKDLDELDEYLGTTKPEGYEPVIVVKNGFIRDESIDVFSFSEERWESFRRISGTVVLDNIDKVHANYGTKGYQTTDKSFAEGEDDFVSVTLKLSEVAAREVRGEKALASFVYKEVGRQKGIVI